MGNRTSQQNYDNYYQDTKELDPYRVLGLDQNFTKEQLKTAYRNISLQVHPDKGGSKELFAIVTDAFRFLAAELRSREDNKPFYELKVEARSFYDKQNEKPITDLEVLEKKRVTPERLNKLFEETRLEEDIEDGYGNLMEPSRKEREDFESKKTSLVDNFDNTKFNKRFEKKTSTSSIILYKEPEPLVLAKSLSFTEIGGDKVTDFTNNDTERRGLQYTDYKRAFDTERLIDPSIIKSRKEFKTVGEYEAYRDRVTKESANDDELRAMKQKEIDEKLAEERRLERVKMRDIKISKQFEKVGLLTR